MALLKAENITFSFPDRIRVLDAISLSIEEGTICALTGSNGAGKTTLFNVITGFLKMNAGTIWYKDRDISGMRPFRINCIGIGRTFQDLRLINKLTVRENLLLAMKDHPSDAWYRAFLPGRMFEERLAAMNKRADEILDEFYLGNLKDSLAGAMSFGEQKLLTIACCVANDAQLILLDEPVAGINHEYQKRIAELLKRLRDGGKTVLLIEHNEHFIQQVEATRYKLEQGALQCI